jgi:thiol-disulfide isomerase/thioredoxin
MRRTTTFFVTGIMAMVLASGAAAQSTPSPATSSQSAQPQDGSSQTAQPMSLGELARLAKAQRQSEPKAVKVVDDENLTRGGSGISVVGSESSADEQEFGVAGSNSRTTGRLSHTGRLTLLDFWATWCGPCRESVPQLKALQQVFRSDQLQVISVDEDKNEATGRSFASEHGMNWEVQFDSSGATARQHNVSAFPTFILVDSSGREVRRFVGNDPSQPLTSRLAPYLSPRASL